MTRETLQGETEMNRKGLLDAATALEDLAAGRTPAPA